MVARHTRTPRLAGQPDKPRADESAKSYKLETYVYVSLPGIGNIIIARTMFVMPFILKNFVGL